MDDETVAATQVDETAWRTAPFVPFHARFGAFPGWVHVAPKEHQECSDSNVLLSPKCQVCRKQSIVG